MQSAPRATSKVAAILQTMFAAKPQSFARQIDKLVPYIKGSSKSSAQLSIAKNTTQPQEKFQKSP